MVTRAELIPIAAEALLEDEGRVGATSRVLRESGFITQGGRGKGGARMRGRDAANLVIGVINARPALSAEIVRDFRKLQRKFGQLARLEQMPSGIFAPFPGSIHGIYDAPTFGEALDAVLSHGCEIESWMRATYELRGCDPAEVPNIFTPSGELRLSVSFFLRPFAAEISLETAEVDPPAKLLKTSYEVHVDPDKFGYGAEALRHGGRVDTVELDHTSLFPIARSVADA